MARGQLTIDDQALDLDQFVGRHVEHQFVVHLQQQPCLQVSALQGRMHGQGKLQQASGVYEGEFRQGALEGQGSYVGKDGERYQGQFARGEFDGQGRLTDSAGTRYEGLFHKGDFTGPGSMALSCW